MPEPPARTPAARDTEMERPRVRYARTKDGVNIAYIAVGQGKALVQMNALPYRHISYQWESLQPIVSRVVQRGRSYVGFDARGLGSSSAANDYSLDAYVSDLEAVADALGLEEFDLAATTYSCPIAIAFAAKHPDRVSRLALEMPFVRGREALDSEIGRTVRALRGQSWEFYTEASMYLIANRDKVRAERSAALLRAAATPEMAKQTWDAVDAFDVSELMGDVGCPTLVTSRADWLLIPVDESRRVAAGIRGAEFLEVADDQEWALQAGIFLGILQRSEAAALTLPPAAPATSSPVPPGTAIILFADVVDSTGLTERLGDASFRAKARVLDATLRRLIEATGGTPIAGRTLGDGVLATFPAARQAIEAALRCASAGDDAGLPLHLGLHAGDVIREGTDIYGGAVNIAARISGLTGPGEVLVSDIVRGLGRTSADVVFEDRGEHALKGVSDAVRIYMVRPKGGQ